MSHPHLAYERILEQTIFSMVRALLREKFEVVSNDVQLDSELVGDLGIEQADIEYLALALEVTFDIDISAAEAAHLVRVRDAVRCILGHSAGLENGRPIPV